MCWNTSVNMDNYGVYVLNIDSLKEELQQISRQIYSLKGLIADTEDPSEIKKLQDDLKKLQFQALFYIEKIENWSKG